MLEIISMKKDHISFALAIWHDQFMKYCGNGSFPDFWSGGEEVVSSYLLHQIEKGNALVAEKDNQLVGFIAWMYFDFHNEATAFCPIVGHSSLIDGEESIYRALYTAASQKWVLANKFNHLWSTYFDDTLLKDMLYDIGFGSYVIDACQKVTSNMIQSACQYRVTKATINDADILLRFANETEKHYYSAPIFLKRDLFSGDEILNIIINEHAFLAWDENKLIGVMSFGTNQGFHFERLTSTQSGYVEGIGGYIKSEYRGQGIGSKLLQEMFNYCNETNKPFVHVSFESANPYAIKFWPKYFKPVIRSVRRTINKDANS